MKLNLYFFILLLGINSCKENDISLEKALHYAGANRKALELVLDYYRSDSLKLEAAKYLIRNMPGHYSFRNTAIEMYYNSIDSLLRLNYSIEALRDTLNKISQLYEGRLDTIQDIKVITSDYLIATIDDAFMLWEQKKWAHHLSFEDFCEYLLPYKTMELQPFDDWRKYFKTLYAPTLKDLDYYELYRNSSIRATYEVNNALRNDVHPNLQASKMYPIHRLSNLLYFPFGTCENYVELATGALRANGIPIMIDITPQWPFRSLGHTWNVVLANSHKNVPFGGADTNPGEPHKLDEKMAKVYRRTYGQNPQLVESSRR